VEEDFSLSNGGINTVPKSLCAETKSYKRHEILLGLSPLLSLYLSFFLLFPTLKQSEIAVEQASN
jgi:hypothetical protein